MTGAKDILNNFGSSRWRVTPEAAAMGGDVTLESGIPNAMNDPNYNPDHKPLSGMRIVTDQLQISTGRILLHELFYLYAKMDIIQSLVRGSCPLYFNRHLSVTNLQIRFFRMAIVPPSKSNHRDRRSSRRINPSHGPSRRIHLQRP
jgi:hypothetical protein